MTPDQARRLALYQGPDWLLALDEHEDWDENILAMAKHSHTSVLTAGTFTLSASGDNTTVTFP